MELWPRLRLVAVVAYDGAVKTAHAMLGGEHCGRHAQKSHMNCNACAEIGRAAAVAIVATIWEDGIPQDMVDGELGGFRAREQGSDGSDSTAVTVRGSWDCLRGCSAVVTAASATRPRIFP